MAHGVDTGADRGAESPGDNGRDMRFQLWGWLLFVVSAGFFVVSGARSGDPAALWGSLLFLAGCIVFLIPLLGTRARSARNPVARPPRDGAADG